MGNDACVKGFPEQQYEQYNLYTDIELEIEGKRWQKSVSKLKVPCNDFLFHLFLLYTYWRIC